MNDHRRLYVLRHAKSSWENPAQDDHDRPLAPRGERAVVALAAHIEASDIRPELVFCSDARRTRDTLEGVGVGGEHRIDRRFYELTCGELLEDLHQLPPATGSVMVIGHNPTMQMIVLKLTGGADPHRAGDVSQNLIDIERKFPTGALATLSFTCSWAELASGSATLEAYVVRSRSSTSPIDPLAHAPRKREYRHRSTLRARSLGLEPKPVPVDNWRRPRLTSLCERVVGDVDSGGCGPSQRGPCGTRADVVACDRFGLSSRTCVLCRERVHRHNRSVASRAVNFRQRRRRWRRDHDELDRPLRRRPIDLSISKYGRVSVVLDEEFDTTETVVGELLIAGSSVPVDDAYPVVFTRLIKLSGTVATNEPADAGPISLTLKGTVQLAEQGADIGPKVPKKLEASYEFGGSYDCPSGRFKLESSLGAFTLEGPPQSSDESKSDCTYNAALPDSACTPGQIRSFSAARVCGPAYTEGARFVSASLRARVFSEYGVAPAIQPSYQVDHLIPVSLGGANSLANLWPQPPSTYPVKDRLEVALWRAVCRNHLTGAEQQNLFVETQLAFKFDWQQAAGLLSTISHARLPGASAASSRSGRPKVFTLTGFGATEAAWSAHHRLDPALGDPSAGYGYYDPHPGLYPGVTDGDEFYVTFEHGRVADYSQNFAPRTSQASATRGVRAFLPADAKLVAGPRNAGPCAIEDFTSHSLAVADHTGATKWGVVTVTFFSYYVNAAGVPYSHTNVESAFVQGGYRDTAIPKGTLGRIACGA